MQDTVAVIGAGGFLGTALTAAFRRSGDVVVGYTRSTPFLSSDGSLDHGVATARTVFWLASSINPAIAEARPDLVRSDEAAFAALLASLPKLSAAPRLVLISSGGAVYSTDAQPPFAETTTTVAKGTYGQAKLRLEAMAAQAGLPAGRTTVLRVANAYGPGQPAASGQGVLAYWLRSAQRGEPLTVYGDPETTRDYVHVDDLTSAMLAVHRAGGALPPVLNLGSGAATSLRELAATVLDVVGDPRLRLVHEPARSFDVPRSWLDIELAAATLGWRPGVDLRTGVASTWRSLNSSLAPAPR